MSSSCVPVNRSSSCMARRICAVEVGGESGVALLRLPYPASELDGVTTFRPAHIRGKRDVPT